MRRSARRATVRAMWACAAAFVPPGMTKLLRGGSWLSMMSVCVSRRRMSLSVGGWGSCHSGRAALGSEARCAPRSKSLFWMNVSVGFRMAACSGWRIAARSPI